LIKLNIAYQFGCGCSSLSSFETEKYIETTQTQAQLLPKITTPTTLAGSVQSRLTHHITTKHQNKEQQSMQKDIRMIDNYSLVHYICLIRQDIVKHLSIIGHR